jgi:hypothetical protein
VLERADQRLGLLELGAARVAAADVRLERRRAEADLSV